MTDHDRPPEPSVPMDDDAGAAARGAVPEPAEPAAGEQEPGLAELRGPLEAILLITDEPVTVDVLATTLDVRPETVETALRELTEEYAAQGRGFDLREVAGGWRFYTRSEHSGVVERFVRDGQEVRLTQAALETLAVVAYRQPVSRARVSAVRGVNCDGVMRTLVLRGLIEEAGHEPETGAILYRTTNYFLERMGLRDLDELPELAPFLPDDVESFEDTDHATT
ncbi:MAG: SMC-Scp complex subunit ScpB [Streptosporangiales bacterium]|nr:SMC-Scp complex subunit ScpB [Streptosporangiales bacterium]